ncbi:MAG: hypothetical protein ACXWIU_12945, partial [Limisphaerales bacterium]
MAKHVRITATILAVSVAVILIAHAFSTSPKPTAILRVVDAAGHPVSGATISREGLRPKTGVYGGIWYPWISSRNGVPNPPVVTDTNGEAQIEYPKYVFEKIETSVVCLSVDHPDFVSQRPERAVDTSLPINASMRDHLAQVASRIYKSRSLYSQLDPIVLKKGGILKISVPPESIILADAPLWGQVSHGTYSRSFWVHPSPGMVSTRYLTEGTQSVRIVQFDPNGKIGFSEVTNIFAKPGVEIEKTLQLQRGPALRGKLDNTVPRPVSEGRVIVNILPFGYQTYNDPPQWHSWTAVRPDGSFEFVSLPPGNLEIAAICQGFISINGSGKFKMRYPQQHTLGTNDLEVVIDMEPTSVLEVTVIDQRGFPLPDARVETLPYLRWAEWT